MSLVTFHPGDKRLYRAERGAACEYAHAFGGLPAYAGLTASDGRPPVHMLFRLDMTDPAVGLDPAGARWLPLLCAIRYGACDLGYRVVSDGEVKILSQREAEPWDDFPYAGYPAAFPEEPISLRVLGYDPDDPKDAIRYSGVFGYDSLTAEQVSTAARFVVDQGLFDPEISDWDSPEEYLREGVSLPYLQGPPTESCPEPTCRNHGRGSSLETLAIFSEEEGRMRTLWGPDGGDLQIIYQICPSCRAIRTTNQCT